MFGKPKYVTGHGWHGEESVDLADAVRAIARANDIYVYEAGGKVKADAPKPIRATVTNAPCDPYTSMFTVADAVLALANALGYEFTAELGIGSSQPHLKATKKPATTAKK